MINSFLLAILSHAVQAIIGSGVFSEIEKLVEAELSTDKTGEEKKASVQASLDAIQGDLGDSVKGTAKWALNLGIETAVAIVKNK